MENKKAVKSAHVNEICLKKNKKRHGAIIGLNYPHSIKYKEIEQFLVIIT